MANKKTNKFANKAADVKKEPAVEIKAEETPVAAPAAETPKAEAPAEKKAPAKKPAVKKEAVKEEKTVVKAEKPAAKKAAPEKSEKLFVEFNGNQYNSEEIIEKCKAAYKGDSKKQVKTIEVYVNVSENKAYYVINGKSGENYYIDL